VTGTLALTPAKRLNFPGGDFVGNSFGKDVNTGHLNRSCLFQSLSVADEARKAKQSAVAGATIFESGLDDRTMSQTRSAKGQEGVAGVAEWDGVRRPQGPKY
jgi:hypothetical protein